MPKYLPEAYIHAFVLTLRLLVVNALAGLRVLMRMPILAFAARISDTVCKY